MKTRVLTASMVAVGLLLTGAACGGSKSNNKASSGSSAQGAAVPSSSAAMSDKPFGAGCAAVPNSGKGSFCGMSADPVATAASNNPVPSTLVTAVKKAGLVDTLNSAQNITVFAPSNDAFKKIPAKTLNKVLADKKMLSSILTYHVVGQKVAPAAWPAATSRPSRAAWSRPAAPASRTRSTTPTTPTSSAATSRPPTRPCTSSTR